MCLESTEGKFSESSNGSRKNWNRGRQSDGSIELVSAKNDQKC